MVLLFSLVTVGLFYFGIGVLLLCTQSARHTRFEPASLRGTWLFVLGAGWFVLAVLLSTVALWPEQRAALYAHVPSLVDFLKNTVKLENSLLPMLALLGVLALAWSAPYYFGVMRKQRDWQLLKQRKEWKKHIVLHLILLTGCVVFILPFLWMVVTSLKPDDQIFLFPPHWIPEPFKWDNYLRAANFMPPETHKGLVFVWNTLYLTLMNVLGVVLSSSMVAFAFARLRWPGRDVIFLIVLATMMLPMAVTMIPVFLIFRSLGWVDTLKPLWVPAFLGGGAFNIFLLRQFFMTIPRDLEEAARIDGCSFWGIYWRIMLPLIKPALAAVTIFTFMGAWNDFMGPLIYISSPWKMNIAYALRLFQTVHGGEWALMMAAATMATLPVLVVFFFTQRHFIEGVTLTGMKG